MPCFVPAQPPRLAPLILDAAAVNDTAIRVSWRATAGDAGSIVGYVVRCVPVSDESDSEKFKEISVNRCDFNSTHDLMKPV